MLSFGLVPPIKPSGEWISKHRHIELLGYAPGGYYCTCVECKNTYEGAKRSTMCLPCAIKRANEILETIPNEKTNKIKEIVSDNELDAVWGKANFGNMSKRDVVKYGLLKCVSGYYQGHTSKTILEELGLINNKYEITAKGKIYLWEAFNQSDL